MSEFIVEYGHGPQERRIGTVDEFDQVWREADRQARSDGIACWMVVYTRAEVSGPTIAIGVGRDFSWLRTDRGDASGDLDPGATTSWAYGNQLGQIPPGRGIGNETARLAVHHFIRTDGGLPDGLNWIRGSC